MATFYGIGAGPGDPELLTLKALRTIERCPVIAAPRTSGGKMLALDIVGGATELEGKIILPLDFTMSSDHDILHEAHVRDADLVETHLAAGRDVAMLNIGDVSIYSTFGYLMDILVSRGYEAVMIPGVPSFCAAAARLGVSLVSADEPLHILPGGGFAEELSGTKVLMKSGKQLPRVIEELKRRGLEEKAAAVQNCGLPEERVCRDLNELSPDAGYFTTIIVKE